MIDTNQERPEFDLLSVKYKTVGTLDENSTDQAIFYDCSSLETIDENTYTTTELLSIELYDIANDFTISRDAYRKLVRLMNTVLRDTEKISRGNLFCWISSCSSLQIMYFNNREQP